MFDCTDMKKDCKWGLEDWEEALFSGWTDDEIALVKPVGREALGRPVA